MSRSPGPISQHAGLGGPSRGPETPHHTKTGKDLDDLIRSLDAECNLNLKLLDTKGSPAKQDRLSLDVKVQKLLGQLFWRSKPDFDALLDNFKKEALTIWPPQERLPRLYALLRLKTPSPNPPSGTKPPSQSPQKSLQDLPSSQSSNISKQFHLHRDHEPRPMFNDPGAVEPGSPTDEDTPPSSPTTSVYLARRRGQGSSHPPFEFKRPSQSSEDSNGSPKLKQTQSPPEPKEGVSPSKTGVSYKIRNIPTQNLFVSDLPQRLNEFPYFILFICLRISIEHKIDMENIVSRLDPNIAMTDMDAFWKAMENDPRIAKPISVREPKGVWSAASLGFDGYVFKGKVTFESRSERSVFRLDLLPVQSDKSCRFERAFGSDRFLYLTFPTFESSRAMEYNKQEQGQVQDYWIKWFNMEHSFLGRKWRAFHAEPSKKKATKKGDKSDGIRVILFATEGIGISQKISIGEMVNWFIPFVNNGHQAVCKAFARLDLGLSRTVPTLAFHPSQVSYIRDTKADGTREDTRFNDPNFFWPAVETNEVMNDGCAQMSFGAAKRIWDIYKSETGVTAPMPSIFQARIGGAKGVWMVSPQTEHTGEAPIWIQITDSQLKFKPHDDDRNDSYDPRRLTFDLVNHSSMPRSSALHISFISIMVDRGVPLATIEKVIRGSLDLERQKLLNTLHSGSQTYWWVDENTTVASGLEGMLWQACLPSRLDDKIRFLLKPGFQPMQEPYLGNILSRFIKQRHQWDEQKLRVSLEKSAYLYGIADPMGVLNPGEIHVKFSEGFDIESTGERFHCLKCINVLVGRQPALRHSDLQKVRTVSYPQLAHLEDVVVFPSKGEYPLAGKLQGGDYDGDTFWICWEPELVEPFKNAPAPVVAPDPAKYGIKVLKTKLPEVMDPNDLSTVPFFLQQAVAFRIGASLLGQATNYHEKQAYRENRVFSPKLDALCDIHDLLVDAPKQGYSCSLEDWIYALKEVIGIRHDPETPAYRRAMEECSKPKEMGEGDKIRNSDYNCNENNTIDYLYFRVVRKHNNETQRLVSELLCKVTNDDPDLQVLYNREKEKDIGAIIFELKRLVLTLDKVEKRWNQLTPKEGAPRAADQYSTAIDECYQMYLDIQPEDAEHPLIQPWLEPLFPGCFTKWDRLRASALYVMYPKKKPTFVFHMAGDVFACMKAESVPFRRRHMVVDDIFNGMKPSRKRMVRIMGLANVEDDDGDAATPMEVTT